MKYLIFGGLGFVGNELVRDLISEGEEVVIADNYFRVAEKIDDIKLVKVINTDIRKYQDVEDVILSIKPDIIINLAAIHYIPECNELPDLAFEVNVNGVVNILKSLKKFTPKHIVLVSSGAVYSDSPEILDEKLSKINPVDIYGVTKKVNEELAFIYSQNFPSVKFSVVRLFNVYGPRETNAHIIPEIISQLRTGHVLKLGNLKPRRDMIYVTDVAKGFIEISKRSKGESFEVINLSSGDHASMEEIIILMSEILGYSIEIQVDPSRFRNVDKMFQQGSIEKIRNLTNYEPIMKLRDGLFQLLKFEELI